MSKGQLLSNGKKTPQKITKECFEPAQGVLIKEQQCTPSPAFRTDTDTLPWPPQVLLFCPASPGEGKSNWHRDTWSKCFSRCVWTQRRTGWADCMIPKQICPQAGYAKSFLIHYIVHWSKKAIACSFHVVGHFLEFALKRRSEITFLGEDKWRQDQFLDFHTKESSYNCKLFSVT